MEFQNVSLISYWGFRVGCIVALWHTSVSLLSPPETLRLIGNSAVAQERSVHPAVSQLTNAPEVVLEKVPANNGVMVSEGLASDVKNELPLQIPATSVSVPHFVVTPSQPASHYVATVNTAPPYLETAYMSPAPVTMGEFLAQAVFNARTSLKAELLPNPAVAKSSLETSTIQLQNFLMSANDSRSADWLRFLRWNELQEQLAKANPDPEKLVQIEKNMRQNYLGLEMPVFTNVRSSLSHYIESIRFGSQPAETIQAIEKRLDQLSTTLQMPAEGSDLERQREIGFVLSLLEQSGQADSLIQTVRSSFSRPNFRVLVTNDFLRQKLVRPISQSNPVHESILGTQLNGTSCLVGQVTPSLISNPNQASLQLLLSANFSSQNVGINRNVRLNTRGAANISAAETISLTDNGLVSNNDTSVHAALRSEITSIEHQLRIVRKIASKKAAEQKPQADAIGQSRLESRIRTQFHEQLTQQIAETNGRMRTPNLPVFSRLGLEKPKRSSWSSGDYLSILWKQQGPTQLAAPGSCPLTVPTHGISIQLHQSAIINAIDPVISGRILRSADLDDMASQLGMDPSSGLREEAGGEPWAITMAGFHPVEIEFDNQLVTFRIRTTKLDRGDQALDQSATIQASYRPMVVDGAIQMEREGDVKIDFVGKAQTGLRGVTMRSFLKKKFDSVFKQQLFDQPLRPTDRLPANLSMRLNDVQVDDGWLQASFQ